MAHANDARSHDDSMDDTPDADPVQKGIPHPEAQTGKDDDDSVSHSTRDTEAKPAEEKETLDDSSPVATDALPTHARFAFWRTKKGKLLAGGIIIAVALAVVCAVPMTRYALLGLIMHHDVKITVLDATTSRPVSNAQVLIGDTSALTNEQGQAQVKHVRAGRYTAAVQKKYYNRTEYALTVGLKKPGELRLNLSATGRQVQLKLINKLTKKPLSKAYITVLDTNATTDDKGEATVVVPASKLTEKAKITKEGFRDLEAEIQVIEQPDERNTLAMVPNGSIAYLSKRTGRINVMKANLDGSDAKVILEGTGQEDERDTVLLAARDWRFAALKAKREGNTAKLYLINLATSAVSTMDEGNATFTPVGWYNEYFVYQVWRTDVKDWQPKQHALKSFNATTGKLITLDETNAEGSSQLSFYAESIQKPYILNNQIAYLKVWGGNNPVSGKRSAIMSVNPDGKDKKIMKDFEATAINNIDARLYKPQEVYFVVFDTAAKPTFYELENGSLESTTSTNQERFYNDTYHTYLLSPSSKKTLWYETRDGRNIVFTGNEDGEQGKEVNSTDDLVAYGWYGEDYLLVSKKGSELFILPFEGADKASPFKITDYHKPALNFSGYGYGYGGF